MRCGYSCARRRSGSFRPRSGRAGTTRAGCGSRCGCLQDERLDRLVAASAPFEQLPAVMAALARGEGEGLCQRIDYES